MNPLKIILASIFFLLAAPVVLSQTAIASVVKQIEKAAGNNNIVVSASVSESRSNGKLTGYQKIFVIKSNKYASDFIKAIEKERTKATKYESKNFGGSVYYNAEFNVGSHKKPVWEYYSIAQNGPSTWLISVGRSDYRTQRSMSCAADNIFTTDYGI